MSSSKRCKWCGKTKPLTDFYRHGQSKDGRRPECKACTAARRKRWYAANRAGEIERVKAWQRENSERYAARLRDWRALNREHKRLADREGHLRRKFGITQAEYEQMLDAQGGGCGVCGDAPRPGQALHVDHDHRTGRVRGLLCVNCNNGLGQFKEAPGRVRMALEYLEAGEPVLAEIVQSGRLTRERVASLGAEREL